MAESADAKQLLYHYTTLDALVSIVTNRELWASHIRYLNDSSEQSIMENLIRNGIEEKLRSATGEEKTKLTKLQRYGSIPLRTGIYIVSLSADGGDRLSQWRAYSGKGGVAIGFDSDELKERCKIYTEQSAAPPNIGAALLEVRYVDPNEKTSALSTIKWLLNQKVSSPSLAGLTEPQLFDASVSYKTSAYKHKAFDEEKEQRIVIVELPNCAEPLYRTRHSMLVPYRAFGLGDTLSPVISRVILGPCPHKQETERAIKGLVGPKIKVVSTDTPYRNW